ncbi:MAG: glycosyltransferase family 2 protein [Bacteroidia bacterium]|nr:glycosyltransferase family 2 protein [Bacteroidia bacterium]MCZ2277006.1 glycosyltransferase family 2 protein [Bacteroidia bacterium]
MKKVAVVILNWNGKKLLEKFLSQVVQCSTEADVIVADNASTDDSLQFLSQQFPGIRLIKLNRNYGFAGGYNACLKSVEAEYFVLLNSDVEVTSGWLKPLISFLDSNPQVAACQPKVRSYYDRHLFEHAGASGGYIDQLGYPFCRGRILNTLEADNSQYNSNQKIFWATGACLMIRRDVFRKLNGFDDRFFAHMEEIDLCWRIQRAGYTLFCIPESVVFHVGGGTLPMKNPRKTYFNFRNNMMMLHNNLPPDKLIPVLIFRLCLDLTAAIKFLVEGDARDALAVLKAHFYFFTRVLMTGGRRNQYRSELPFTKPTTVFKGSVVWNYYLRNKKKFSDLNFEVKS